jgi:hypothetical protein
MSETAEAPAVDGEATEIREPEPQTTTVSTAVAVRTITNEVIRPLAAADVKAAMVEHQALLREILDPSDWQGPPDQQGSFVKKSGWRKVALSYNLTLERVGEEVERDDGGTAQRATYTARAVAPNGRSVEATGHCAFSESRFSGPRGNTTKLENDMRATAETRAKNRAISDLIGMGKVSAEEVDAGHANTESASPELVSAVHQIIAWFVGQDQAGAQAVAERLMAHFDGELPKAAGEAIAILGRAVKDHRDAQHSDRAAA